MATRVFISQPMRGKTDQEIIGERANLEWVTDEENKIHQATMLNFTGEEGDIREYI